MAIYDNRLSGCTSCTPNKPKDTSNCKDSTSKISSKCDIRKITNIIVNKDKIIVTYDDCSYNVADISVLSGNSSSSYDDTELKDKITKLDERVTKLENQSIEISDLSKPIFKASKL